MKALLVIDMQNICVGKQQAKLFNYDSKNLIMAVNGVIENNKENLVVYIRNFMKKNIINKFAPVQIYDGMEEGELADELAIVSEYVFDKYAGDAFTNEKLAEFLKEKCVDTVEVIGVDGGGCVALTALGAVKNGFHVIVNTKAIGTVFEKQRDKFFKQLKAMDVEFL